MKTEEKLYCHATNKHMQMYLIPPSCAQGKCLWEESYSHCLVGSHTFTWRSYKRQWRKKLKMTTGFSCFFVPWIGRARGEAHPISWERNTVPFSSLYHHFTSKKISVGKVKKDHHHTPKVFRHEYYLPKLWEFKVMTGKKKKALSEDIWNLRPNTPEDIDMDLHQRSPSSHTTFPQDKTLTENNEIWPLIIHTASLDSPSIIPL